MGLKLFSDTQPSDCCGQQQTSFDHYPSNPSGSEKDLFIKPPKRDGNPNKYRYNIIKTLRIGNTVAVHINYPDCYNYKGDKICVYEDAYKFLEIHHQKRCIDPHFLETNYSPVARFEPTPRGWDLAINFAKMFSKDIQYK